MSADHVPSAAEASGNLFGPVELVTAVELHSIRKTVLRDGTPSDNVHLPVDDHADAVHTAIRDGAGTVVASASWSPAESPDAPGEPALQLRGMAVAASARRQGLGERLIATGAELAAERGIAVLWANARDTALDFYRAAGFDVVGDGFVTTDTSLPHHRILRRLA